MVAMTADRIGELVRVGGEQRMALEQLIARIDATGDVPPAVRDLLERTLLRAVESQHRALDIAFTLVCMREPEFRPSKSDQWPAVEQGNRVMVHARQHLGVTVDDR